MQNIHCSSLTNHFLQPKQQNSDFHLKTFIFQNKYIYIFLKLFKRNFTVMNMIRMQNYQKVNQQTMNQRNSQQLQCPNYVYQITPQSQQTVAISLHPHFYGHSQFPHVVNNYSQSNSTSSTFVSPPNVDGGVVNYQYYPSQVFVQAQMTGQKERITKKRDNVSSPTSSTQQPIKRNAQKSANIASITQQNYAIKPQLQLSIQISNPGREYHYDSLTAHNPKSSDQLRYPTTPPISFNIIKRGELPGISFSENFVYG